MERYSILVEKSTRKKLEVINDGYMYDVNITY